MKIHALKSLKTLVTINISCPVSFELIILNILRNLQGTKNTDWHINKLSLRAITCKKDSRPGKILYQEHL